MSVRPLSDELAEKARLELNEDPSRISDDIQHIKDWLAKQPHLRARTGELKTINKLLEYYTKATTELENLINLTLGRRSRCRDDQWLLAFLRGCKFSLERTKEKLDLYYTVRNTAPELYRIKHTDPLFNEILELGSLIVLPKLVNATAPRVSMIRPGSYNPDKYAITDVISVKTIIDKILLMEDDNLAVAGSQNILDLDNVTMKHFLQMTPMVIKKLVVSTQDALPLRVKGTHYLNTPTGFETIFNAFKTLLTAKNQSRLYVHNKNYDEMYKYISKDILPNEYGGEGGTIKEITDYWKKKVEEYSDFLEADYQYGTDETKRRGKPKTAEDMFGLEGSFRQLQFD